MPVVWHDFRKIFNEHVYDDVQVLTLGPKIAQWHKWHIGQLWPQNDPNLSII